MKNKTRYDYCGVTGYNPYIFMWVSPYLSFNNSLFLFFSPSVASEVPTINMATSKQSESMTVEFTQVSGATSYILRAETADMSFFYETEVPSSPGTVLNLQAYTDYTLSVMSINSGGRSQPSLPVVAKTGIVPCISHSHSPSVGGKKKKHKSMKAWYKEISH